MEPITTLEDLTLAVIEPYARALQAYWENPASSGYPPTFHVGVVKAGRFNRLDIPVRFGELLESERGKDLLFGALKTMREVYEPDMMCFVHDAWSGLSTQAGLALGYERFNELTAKHGTEWMFRQGYMTRREVVSATAQSPTEVVSRIRPYAHQQGKHWTWFPEEVNRQPLAALSDDSRFKLW